MSKKGVDISFIKPAVDNDDWKREVTDQTGTLVIVEVFSSKWGPCSHLDGHYQALYYDKAESFAIKFVRAQADAISALITYKDSSKPCFLLYLDQAEQAKIEGPNLPELRKQIAALAPAAAA